MKAVVVYESMYGNTHAIADAIARGIESADGYEAVVVESVARADQQLIAGADLVVVGGPTHAHGMTRPGTRKQAVRTVKPAAGMKLEPDAGGVGVRDWLDSLGPMETRGAAFDTRMKGPALLTGRASTGIAKQLRDHRVTVVSKPESFLVDKSSQLVSGEIERARNWGRQLAASALTGATSAQ